MYAIRSYYDLRATALTHDTLRLDRLALSAALRDGQLDLERLAGTLHGGTVQVTGTVDLREEIAASLDVAAVEVDLGELFRITSYNVCYTKLLRSWPTFASC